MTLYTDTQVATLSLDEVLSEFRAMQIKYIKFDDEHNNIMFNETGYLTLYRRWKDEILGEQLSLAMVFGNLIRMHTDSNDAIEGLLTYIRDLTKDVVLDDTLDLYDPEVIAELTIHQLTSWVVQIDKQDLVYNEELDRVDVADDEHTDDQQLLEYWNENGPEHLVWALNSAIRTREAIEVQYLDFMDMISVPIDGEVDLGAKADAMLNYGLAPRGIFV